MVRIQKEIICGMSIYYIVTWLDLEENDIFGRIQNFKKYICVMKREKRE